MAKALRMRNDHKMPHGSSLAVLHSVLFLFLMAVPCQAAPAKKAPPAKLKVSGYGFLGNRQLKRMLTTVELSSKKPQFFDPGFVEDAALLLDGRVKNDGYLQPSIMVDLTTEDGRRLHLGADNLANNPLPRPLRIKRAQFTIHKGKLFYYRHLEFDGLEALDEKAARAAFMEAGPLLPLKRGRVYTPEKLRRSLSSLTDILDQEGYREARAEATRLDRDDKTGAVSAHIGIHQGSKFLVHSVQEEFFYEGTQKPGEARTVHPDKPYSHVWLQDFSLSLKTNQYHRGFPDVTVEIRQLRELTETNSPRSASQPAAHAGTLAGKVFPVPKKTSFAEKVIGVDLFADVRSGPQVRIGAVNFEGQKITRVRFMARRVRVQRGELLDRIKAEDGRYRLAQVGAFDTVDLNYKPVDEHTRDVIYHVKENKRLDVSLLAGYGSYEELRGGVEAIENNLWGLGHRAQIKGVQSFKSSQGEFTYTVPDFNGADMDAFVHALGLRRQEVSFVREDYGGGIGVHEYFKPSATDLTLRYNYQIFDSLNTTLAEVSTEGVTNPTVGAIIIEAKHDRRDNPLYPRKGYKVFVTVTSAAQYFGGDVNYERVDAFASWHHPIGDGRWISLGLSHGVDVSFGSPQHNLPFDQRFFPGGENSIRGYEEDQASPRNTKGQIVGCESYALGTVEFEQSLTPKWSVVIFSDSLGFAEHVAHYPFDTGLFSVGGGLRWKTLIGPLRLEYGQNVNPRKQDPSGTLQISLGFPF